MASSYPTIRYGSSGQEVRRLQQALNREGYSLDVDGGFGKKTLAALMDYQRRVGMTPDGVAGSKTWASLGGTGSSGRPGEGVYAIPGDPGRKAQLGGAGGQPSRRLYLPLYGTHGGAAAADEGARALCL